MNDKEIITERACSKIMAQLPVDQDGRLYHLGLKAGECRQYLPFLIIVTNFFIKWSIVFYALVIRVEPMLLPSYWMAQK